MEKSIIKYNELKKFYIIYLKSKNILYIYTNNMFYEILLNDIQLDKIKDKLNIIGISNANFLNIIQKKLFNDKSYICLDKIQNGFINLQYKNKLNLKLNIQLYVDHIINYRDKENFLNIFDLILFENSKKFEIKEKDKKEFLLKKKIKKKNILNPKRQFF